MRKTVFAVALTTSAVFLCGPPEARAGFIDGHLWVNRSGPASNALLGFGDPSSGTYLGTADAMFDSGAFNYNSSIGGYTIGGFLNNPAFTNTSAAFTAHGGAAGDLNQTYFYFTGAIHLNAGNNSFVVAHDDGLQLNVDGVGLVVNQPGPTAPVFTPFNVNAPSAGNYNFELSYGETAGPPATLVWQVNGATITSNAVPEPATLTMLGVGVLTIGGYARKRREKVVVTAS